MLIFSSKQEGRGLLFPATAPSSWLYSHAIAPQVLESSTFLLLSDFKQQTLAATCLALFQLHSAMCGGQGRSRRAFLEGAEAPFIFLSVLQKEVVDSLNKPPAFLRTTERGETQNIFLLNLKIPVQTQNQLWNVILSLISGSVQRALSMSSILIKGFYEEFP